MPNPVIRSMTALCTNATVQDVSIDEWNNNVNMIWREVTGIDRSNAPTLLEVGVKRGGNFYPFRSNTPGAAGRSVRLHGQFTAPGQFCPTARFWGATLGDTLELYVAGEVAVE